MGCFDSVAVPCPKCGEIAEFQSKSGQRYLGWYTLSTCPVDVMRDVNRHAPVTCGKCGTKYKVDFKLSSDCSKVDWAKPVEVNIPVLT